MVVGVLAFGIALVGLALLSRCSYYLGRMDRRHAQQVRDVNDKLDSLARGGR